MAKKNFLNSIKVVKPGKNVFDLSHDVKLSCNMGELIPIMLMDCVPGDKVTLGCESMVRLAPMLAPMMHRCDISMHYFFVPNRIVWPNWEKFITGNEGQEVPAPPYITVDPGVGTDYSRLLNYMGIPIPAENSGDTPESISAIPLAAYHKIVNEYYRDQNLQVPFPDVLVDGNNAANKTELITLRNRCWEHDYFTACLPTAQMGASVDIPLGEVQLNEDWIINGQQPKWREGIGNTSTYDGEVWNENYPNSTDPARSTLKNPANSPTLVPAAYDPDGTLEVGATTINDLRRAFRLQEWLEKSLRGGKRYVENILIHFGVRSSDKRLQRPEYITGIKAPIQISEVLNTTGTTEAPQGNMAGHGVGVTSGKYGKYFCEEHGYIVGLLSVMPKTAYQQGIERHWKRLTDPFEYYWPTFAHIGEQEVKNSEVFAFRDYGAGTFGYMPRYGEYRYMNNRVAGAFQTTLDFWHMGRIFNAKPELNSDFVECVPTKRVFAVEDDGEDCLWIHVYNKVMAVRPIPKFGTPTF